MLYFSVVRHKLDYASAVWSSIASNDANYLGSIQRYTL